MNVGTYLMLTVPLVGGSLYVYDSLRPAAAPAAETAGAPLPVTRPEPRESAQGPTLAGDPQAEVQRQVRAELERILRERAASQAKSGESGEVGVVAGEGESSGRPSLPALSFGDEELLGGDGTPVQYDEKSLKVFRAYLDEAQRREREERLTQMVTSNLDRLGLSLSEGQRKTVIDLTMRYTKARRDAFAGLQPGQENREARQKVAQDARDAYSKAVYDAVPAAEAEKIVNALAQFGRGGPEWGAAGGDRGPAMGGGVGGGGNR